MSSITHLFPSFGAQPRTIFTARHVSNGALGVTLSMFYMRGDEVTKDTARIGTLGCANEYIRQHGLDAPVFAVMRADKLLEVNDLDGVHDLRLILQRVNWLLESTSGEPN